MDIMFEIPSKPNVKQVIIDEGVVNLNSKPKLVYRTDEELENLESSKADADDDSAESA